MREDWDPRLAAVSDLFRQAEAAAAALAADIGDGGSHQAVKDTAQEIAGAAAKLAGTTDDLHATSRTADATAWQFTEAKDPSQAQDWT